MTPCPHSSDYCPCLYPWDPGVAYPDPYPLDAIDTIPPECSLCDQTPCGCDRAWDERRELEDSEWWDG